MIIIKGLLVKHFKYFSNVIGKPYYVIYIPMVSVSGDGEQDYAQLKEKIMTMVIAVL